MTSATPLPTASRLLALAAIASLVAACGASIATPGVPSPGAASPPVTASVGPPSPVITGSPGPTQASTPAPTHRPTATPTHAPTAAPATAPPPTPVGGQPGVAACAPPDVSVGATGEGAGGSIVLAIEVTNTGHAACVLTGPPSSIALRAGGATMPLTYQARDDPWPGSTPGVVAAPVVLRPHAKAQARAVWRNWCLGPAEVETVWVGFGPQAIDASPFPFIQPPRCDNPSAESTVQGFPYEADKTGG